MFSALCQAGKLSGRMLRNALGRGAMTCVIILVMIGTYRSVADAAEPTEAATATPANGEKSAKPGWFDLPEVLVTARGEMESFAAPYATNVVPTSDFASQRLFRTPTQALNDVPGIMVQKTGHAQGSPYIRGFTGFRTLMLVDGIRLNNSVFRDGPNQYWNLIDPYTISRMEAVKGPSSVLHGSDAVGGTVNAILRRPDGYTDGLNWYRELSGRVSTAERSWIGRAEVNATYGSTWGVRAGGTWKDFGNVDGGSSVGPQDWTGYGVCSGDFRLEYHPDKDITWTLAHYQLYEDNAWRTHKTIHGISWEGTSIGNERMRAIDESRSLTYLRYAWKNMGGLIDAMELTSSYQTLSERRWRIRSDGRADRQGIDLYTLGFGAQFQSPSRIGRWTYGVEWYHDEVDSFDRRWNADGSFAGERLQGPVGDDANYNLMGVYVQNCIPLGDRLEAILGGRYTYARAAADEVSDPNTGDQISITEDYSAFVGSARLSWLVDSEEHWNVFGGVSQGFRAPNLSDLARLDSARSDEIETPSPGLDPERYISYEAGVKAQYENFVAQAAYFFTDIEDMIVRTPTGNIVDGDNEVTKANAGDGYVHGVELGGKVRVAPRWSVFGNVAWMYGEVDTYPTSAAAKRREPIDRLMPTTGQLGLRWDHANGKFWAETVCTAACRADELSTRDRSDAQRIPPGGTPGYVTADLRGGWRVNETLDLWAAIENLTNEDYRTHGSGVNEPGINFKFGFKVRF